MEHDDRVSRGLASGVGRCARLGKMRARTGVAALAAAITAASLGCAHSFGKLPVQKQPITVPCRRPDCEPLLLQYLGSGGFVMRHRGDVILTAPFFSHTSLIRTGLGRLHQATDVIDRYLPDVSGAQAILSGHSHYDHLFDVPYVMEHKAPAARLYANRTGRHLVAARHLESRTDALDDLAWPGPTSRWIAIPGTRVRFLAIKSDHAPHFGPIRFWDGQLEKNEGALPRRASGWVRGTSHNFLIEFLAADGSVAHRVFYQDAAADPGVGVPPLEAGDPSGCVDVAIFTAASFELVADHPGAMLRRLKPRFTVMAHWEDFFRPYTHERSELRVVRGTNPRHLTNELRRLLDESDYTLPVPGGCICVAGPNGCGSLGACR